MKYFWQLVVSVAIYIAFRRIAAFVDPPFIFLMGWIAGILAHSFQGFVNASNNGACNGNEG